MNYQNEVMGYKVFNSDWTCRGFQYEVGKTYELKGKAVPCESGFHFCKVAVDCFNYYTFDPDNKVAIVKGYSVVEQGDKCCAGKIEIVEEVTWEKLLTTGIS